MESTRQKKISRLLQKELAELLRQKAQEIAKGKLITVTVVRVSPDLGIAKVYLSIFPSNESEEILGLIDGANKKLRLDMDKQLRNQLRLVPELSFYLDDSLDYIDNIDSLLKP